jgi:cytochrome c2
LLLHELNALHAREKFLDNGFQGLFTSRHSLPSCNDSLPVLLATADIIEGKWDARKDCGNCHKFEQEDRQPDGPEIGPPLWGVVGRPVGSKFIDYKYSAALVKKGRGWSRMGLS